MDLLAPQGIASLLRLHTILQVENHKLKSKLASLFQYLTLAYVTALTDLGELYLCLGTIAFPLFYLCLAVAINWYLIIKLPACLVIHDVIGSSSPIIHCYSYSKSKRGAPGRGKKCYC